MNAQQGDQGSHKNSHQQQGDNEELPPRQTKQQHLPGDDEPEEQERELEGVAFLGTD